MDSDVVLLEGGANAAEILLAHYDPGSRRWSIPQEGEFWESVHSAHKLGRFGEGARIAIIDGGFDISLPALAEQRLRFPVRQGEPTAHGTVVALLALEVAPLATLDLYPCYVQGKLQAQLVLDAINQAVADGASVVNLSLGKKFPLATAWKATGQVDSDAFPEAQDSDDWRLLFDVPKGPLWVAAQAAVQAGVSVIASAGNSEDYLYVPAATPGVTSTGFQMVRREIDAGGLETAVSEPPSLLQSIGSDFLIAQPAGVLGSSFACPLVAGFATLMKARELLPQYVRCTRRAANASSAMVLMRPPAADDLALVHSLFSGALQSSPHPHYKDAVDNISECPDCSAFAVQAYINFGLFLGLTGNLDYAAHLLQSARRIAPANVHAAANLGVTYGAKAWAAKVAGNIDLAMEYLQSAAEQMEVAIMLRPSHAPYKLRLHEFTRAVIDPMSWSFGTTGNSEEEETA